MRALPTALCGALGIEVPILSLGFGESAGPEFVAAVLNAAGRGVLGVTGGDAARGASRPHPMDACASARPFGGNVVREFVRDVAAELASAG